MINIRERDSRVSFEITVDLGVYSESAVKKACYRICDEAVTQLSQGSDTSMLVEVTITSESDPELIKGRFLRELLDYDLRERVAEQTTPIRNLIMAHALSKVPLINAELHKTEIE